MHFLPLLLLLPLVSATHLHQHLDHYEQAFVTRITPLVHTSARPTPVAKLHDSEQWMVSAFGQHFMLTLNRNHQFLSSNYKSYVIHTDEDNRVEEVTADHGEGNRNHCYFFGQVNGVDTHAKSYAALSLCNGSLHGEIVTEDHTFFIEPNHLHFDYNPEKDYSDSCKGHTHCHAHWEHIQNTLKSSFGVERVQEDKLITKRLQHVVYKNEHHKSVRMECGVNHNGVHEDHDEHDHLHDVHFGGLAVNKLATGSHFDTTANRDINYVELLIVNDVKRKSTFASVNLMQANSEVLVYIVHTRYLVNNFSPQVHVILTAQISISGSTDPWGTPGVCSQPQYVGAIDHTDLLSKFSNWAYGSTVSGLITNGANWDNAHLLSGYHFCGYAVGFAGTGSMCFDGSSTGISQPLYADQQSANIITHEMGHNFNMNHDGTGNTCPQSGYIMAAVADLTANSYTTEFSTCSKAYYNRVMKYRPTSMACLNNLPEVRYASSCGNGWVDAGEECDCGSSDCSSIDPCCDGSTCNLVNAAECSNLDACCQSCQIVSSAQNKVCRASSHATCDYAEVCNGVSGLCPNDVFARTGASCSDGYGTGTYFNGKCYRGMCITLGAQCMGLYDNTSSACPGSSICGQPIQCNSNENSGACTSYPAFWGDGSSCGALSQCYNGNCILSSLLEYSWDTYCSLSCGSTVITKQIKCRWYDGSWVADSFCSASTKPAQTGACGSFAPQICSSSLTTSTGTSNVAAGGSITLSWTTLFKVNYVIILAVSSSSSWPEYLSLGSADDGTESYTIPVKFASGPNVVQLWVASNVYANVSTIDVTDSCSSLSCGSNTCENGACVCPDSKQGDTCASNYGLCPTCSCGSWRTGPNCEFMYAKLTIYHAPSTNALTTFDSASISGTTASLKERRRFGQLYQQEIAFLAYVNASRVFVDYLSISVESDGSIGVPVLLVGNDTAKASMEDLIVKLNYSIGAPYAGNASRLFAARHVNKNRAMKIEGDGLFPDGNQPVNFLDWIRNNPGAVAGIVIALAIIILALVCVKHPPEKVRETAQKVRRKHRKHRSRDREDRDRYESEEGL